MNIKSLGEAGVAAPLVEVLKTRVNRPGILNRAYWAVGDISLDGERKKKRIAPATRIRW